MQAGKQARQTLSTHAMTSVHYTGGYANKFRGPIIAKSNRKSVGTIPKSKADLKAKISVRVQIKSLKIHMSSSIVQDC